MRGLPQALPAFGLALLVLGIGIGRSGIAAQYSDPVGHLRAQDESVYANSATGLAEKGGWITPKVMGRFLLFKPPLLVWSAGLSLKIFGKTLWALRLPDLLAAALGSVLVFLWAGGRGWGAWAALLLLLGNPLWHTFARLCYTDMLLAASVTGALYCLHRDPELQERRSLLGFSVCTAVAILAKNIAGLMPLLVLLLYSAILFRSGPRPSVKRILQATGLVVLISAPWHLYQLVVHRDWFLADYIGVQILGYGLKPATQNTLEGQILFYAKRLFVTDPVLCVLALAGLIFLLFQYRKQKNPDSLLLLCWLGLGVATLLAFRFRNLPYALGLIPPLCLIASRILRQPSAVALLAGVLMAKALIPDQPRSLTFGSSPPIPEAVALRGYWQLGRPNELMVVDPADEFFSFNLPGLKVHYCFPDPSGAVVQSAPHYGYLGILMPSEQFLDLEQHRPEFEQRLKAWGLPSGEPIATAITVRSVDEILNLTRQKPSMDFDLPQIWADKLGPEDLAQREVRPASAGRIFLLASNPSATPTIRRPALPAAW